MTKNKNLIFKDTLLYVISFFVMTIIADCGHKPQSATSFAVSNSSAKLNLDMKLENLFIGDSSLYSAEGDNILLEIEVHNNTNKDIPFGSLDYYAESAGSNGLMLPSDSNPVNPKEVFPTLRGFYLLSNEFQPGAIKLQYGKTNKDDLIEANHSKMILIFSNCVYLRYFLKQSVHKGQEKAYSDVLSFLNKNKYSLIYVSVKDSVAFVVPKSNTFKVTVVHSLTAVLEKLGKK